MEKINEIVESAKKSIKPNGAGYGYAAATFGVHRIELRLIPCDSHSSTSSWGRQCWYVNGKVAAKAKAKAIIESAT